MTILDIMAIVLITVIAASPLVYTSWKLSRLEHKVVLPSIQLTELELSALKCAAEKYYVNSSYGDKTYYLCNYIEGYNKPGAMSLLRKINEVLGNDNVLHYHASNYRLKLSRKQKVFIRILWIRKLLAENAHVETA